MVHGLLPQIAMLDVRALSRADVGIGKGDVSFS
jgi:hypothetical protein